MNAPQSLEEAQALLDRLAKHQAAKSRFVVSLTVGRDGKPLPGWVTIGDCWTDNEANRLFAQACQAEGITESDASEMEAANRTQLALYLRKAGRLVGLTQEGLQKLEQAIADM